MGKRSSFERRPGDFYPTPRAAVLPLIPHLRGVRTFAEPCCGDGALVRHLESLRAALRLCRRHRDRPGRLGARRVRRRPTRSSPTRRTSAALLHPLIPHFQRIAPTWLLLDQDWAPPNRRSLTLEPAPTSSLSGASNGFPERKTAARTISPGTASTPAIPPARSFTRFAQLRCCRRLHGCARTAAAASPTARTAPIAVSAPPTAASAPIASGLAVT